MQALRFSGTHHEAGHVVQGMGGKWEWAWLGIALRKSVFHHSLNMQSRR